MKLYRVSQLLSAIVLPSVMILADSSFAHTVYPGLTQPANSLTIAQISTDLQAFDLRDRGVPGRREGGGTR